MLVSKSLFGKDIEHPWDTFLAVLDPYFDFPLILHYKDGYCQIGY